jgi:hypothetical protein
VHIEQIIYKSVVFVVVGKSNFIKSEHKKNEKKHLNYYWILYERHFIIFQKENIQYDTFSKINEWRLWCVFYAHISYLFDVCNTVYALMPPREYFKFLEAYWSWIIRYMRYKICIDGVSHFAQNDRGKPWNKIDCIIKVIRIKINLVAITFSSNEKRVDTFNCCFFTNSTRFMCE